MLFAFPWSDGLAEFTWVACLRIKMVCPWTVAHLSTSIAQLHGVTWLMWQQCYPEAKSHHLEAFFSLYCIVWWVFDRRGSQVTS